jgi:zinc D-Ala-D-Ala dipeptidase
MKTQVHYRDLPMPPSASLEDNDDYQKVEIDKSSTEYDEPLVDVATADIANESFYYRDDKQNAPLNCRFNAALQNVYVRTGVAYRLQLVNKILETHGMELVVLDGFRPIAVQAELWDWMLQKAADLLPTGSHTEREAYALRFASNPTAFDQANSQTWPTHSTGAAVDVTLQELKTGRRANMGGDYLDVSASSTTRYYEQLDSTNSSLDNIEAQANRRLLYWAMTAVGFVNYAFEWWHFDYLTQAAVWNLGMPAGRKANYGLANRGQSPEV